MDKFPLIAKWLSELERKIIGKSDCYVIDADDLERELAKGLKVLGYETSGGDVNWSKYESHLSRHEALLIGPRPLKQPRKREVSEEIVRKVLREAQGAGFSGSDYYDTIIERLFGESEER